MRLYCNPSPIIPAPSSSMAVIMAVCWSLLAVMKPVHSFTSVTTGIGFQRHVDNHHPQQNNGTKQHHDKYSIITTTHLGSSNNNMDKDAERDDGDDDERDDIDVPINQDIRSETSINVLGTSLIPCCTNVRNTGIGTGFYRNGYCSTGDQDIGRHTVCVQVTKDFLQYSKSVGNDLSTPVPEYMFPGLQEGDIWCLCAQRWAQAYNAGKAPQVYLSRTHEKTLTYVPLDILRLYAIDSDEAEKALKDLNDQRDRLNKLL